MNKQRQSGRSGRFLGAAVLAAAGLAAPAAFGVPSSEAAANAQHFLADAVRPDSPPWRYAQVPGYEVISECGDDETNDVLRSLVAGREVSEFLLPPGFFNEDTYPSSVILYNARPGEAAGGPVRAVPSRNARTAWRTQFDEEAQPIPESRVNEMDGTSACIELPPADGPVPCIGGKGYPDIPRLLGAIPRFQAAHRVPEFPQWLVAGLVGPGGPLASGWRVRQVVPTHLDLPTALWVDSAETAYVRQHGRPSIGLIPARQFFEDAGPHAAAWNSQAALFVRWGLFSRAYALGSHTRAFWNFVARATGRPVDEAMFRASFGFGYRELDAQLSGMLPDAVSNFVATQVDINLRPAIPALRIATPGEVGRIVGDWERAQGEGLAERFPEVSSKLLDAAGATLETAQAGAGQDAEVSGALGIYEAQAGRTDAALADLEAAVRGQFRRPLVYLALAQLRYRAFEARARGHGGKFDAAQEAAVFEPLQAARKLLPSTAATYRMAARAILRGSDKPTGDELSLMAEGRQLYWRDPVFGGLADRVEAMAEGGRSAGG
ncbi:MAG TPA: hypothetical protein VGG34_13410 [Opitutaceae bacterium]|jgi:hypothetical protein